MHIRDYVDDGTIRFRTNHREKYHRIRDKDEYGLFSNVVEILYTAFAIGFYYNQQKDITADAINHANLMSFDRNVKEIMALLTLSRHKEEITSSKDLWSIVGRYAEYGIDVLYNKLEENHWSPVIDDLVLSNEGE